MKRLILALLLVILTFNVFGESEEDKERKIRIEPFKDKFKITFVEYYTNIEDNPCFFYNVKNISQTAFTKAIFMIYFLDKDGKVISEYENRIYDLKPNYIMRGHGCCENGQSEWNNKFKIILYDLEINEDYEAIGGYEMNVEFPGPE